MSKKLNNQEGEINIYSISITKDRISFDVEMSKLVFGMEEPIQKGYLTDELLLMIRMGLAVQLKEDLKKLKELIQKEGTKE